MHRHHCASRWAIALAAALLLFATGRAPANLITNGSFEGSTFTDPTTGDTLPTGWTLGPPSPSNLSKVNVDSAVNAPTDLGPFDGTHYLRFQSTANNGTRDCVWQDIPTTPGASYTISFAVAITSTSVGNNLGLDPIWDENTANATSLGTSDFYFNPTNTAPVPYQVFSFTETASGSLTRLDFHAVDSDGSILLDQVSVSAVPEPASIGLFGLAGVSFLSRRRRA
jgi:hypothetical protein